MIGFLIAAFVVAIVIAAIDDAFFSDKRNAPKDGWYK